MAWSPVVTADTFLALTLKTFSKLVSCYKTEESPTLATTKGLQLSRAEVSIKNRQSGKHLLLHNKFFDGMSCLRDEGEFQDA